MQRCNEPTCTSQHDLFDENFGSNVFLDAAHTGGPTVASFDLVTDVNTWAHREELEI